MARVPYDFWADYVSELAALHSRPIRRGGRLLDLATGTGSVALEFAARGSIATGIDASEPMLAEARHKATQKGLHVKFVCQNLTDFDLPPTFDHAVCLYDSLNYLLQPSDIKRAFANARRALAPSGAFIFDVNTVRALEAELFTQRSPRGAPVEYDWRSTYDPSSRRTRIRMDFRIPHRDQRFTIYHDQRAYTDAEIRSYLGAASFGDVAAYDGYRLVPPTENSDRVFYVALA
jgi:ubiquinone/menaquinone biosynthesis C-methylase UbiE